MKSRNFTHKLLAIVLLAGVSATASAQMLINGAGATFPYPIYSKWFDEYVKVDPSVRFNYQSIGSGGGQKQILAQTVDFGASDGPMSDENLGESAWEDSAHSDGRRSGGVDLQFAWKSETETRCGHNRGNVSRSDQKVE